jgi:hypothetical protein
VAHLVHHVVGHVAVHRPVAGLVGDELDVAGAADRDEDGGLGPLRRDRERAAVGRHDLEVVAVQVDRVVIHGAQVAEADPHAVALAADQRRGAGVRLRVHREDVEVGHLVGVGRFAPGTTFHSLSMITKSRSTR